MTRTNAERKRPAPAEVSAGDAAFRSYLRESEGHWASLVFLIPFMVVYEVGTHYIMRGGVQGRPQIIAFKLAGDFFGLFGLHFAHLPALAVVMILLASHVMGHASWAIRPGTLLGMAFESVILAVPLLVLGMALPRYFPLAASDPQREMLVLSVGAGVYEELIFRLVLMTALSMIVKDGLRMPAGLSALLVVVVSALAFSAYHYLSPTEAFHARTFTFRTVAGIYFGVLFITRGFGITAGTHSAYDICVVMLTAASA